MARTIVGVIRGGASSEYNLSLKTGANMLAALPESEYDTRDIFIDRKGLWHLRGIPTTPARAFTQMDVVLNALHGGAGEDGTVQRLIARAGVPYAGSRPLPSHFSLNKIRSRDILQKAGVKVPRGAAFTLGDGMTTGEMARSVFSQFGPPYIVKPGSEGASMGVQLAMNLLELPDVLGSVLDSFGSALVEEFVRGHDVSVGVIEGYRGQDLYALPPVHMIAPPSARFIDFDAHHTATISHRVPSAFSDSEKRALMDAARAAHRALGLSHFSRADLILTPRTVYVLETNSVPGLYPGASFPAALESVGSSIADFLRHSLSLARSG